MTLIVLQSNREYQERIMHWDDSVAVHSHSDDILLVYSSLYFFVQQVVNKI